MVMSGLGAYGVLIISIIFGVCSFGFWLFMRHYKYVTFFKEGVDVVIVVT